MNTLSINHRPTIIEVLKNLLNIILRLFKKDQKINSPAIAESRSFNELRKLLDKIYLINSEEIKIIVNGKSQNFLKYAKEFEVPQLEKGEKIETPFSLIQGSRSILEGNIKVEEYKDEIHISLNGCSNSAEDPLASFHNVLSWQIRDKYYFSLYEEYLKSNSLDGVSKSMLEMLRTAETALYSLELFQAKQVLNDMETTMASYKHFNAFFRKIEGKITKKKKMLGELEKISNPEMPILKRIDAFTDYERVRYAIVPGEGSKKCVIGLHGIQLYSGKKERIFESLEENGFGGSIILCDLWISFLELFLIKEKKLGAIIHNTGTWHESTLEELFDNSYLNEEDKKFCRSIPHNKNGANGSEFLLAQKQFQDRITNFVN